MKRVFLLFVFFTFLLLCVSNAPAEAPNYTVAKLNT